MKATLLLLFVFNSILSIAQGVNSFPTTGNVNIGAVSTGSYKLAVAGKIAATGEVRVFNDGTITFPDYVFEPGYKLFSIEEIDNYIQQHKHLPEVPSAMEVEEKGMSLNEMNLILLKKVEELTLHMIELNKQIKDLKKDLKRAEDR